MQLIVCLADGQDITTQYNPGEVETPLEKALSCFEKVLDDYEGSPEEIKAVRDEMKVQAVMMLCRAEEFKQAKKVLQKVWFNSDEPQNRTEVGSPGVLQKRLKSFIDDKRMNARFLSHHTYENFLQQTVCLLQKVYDSFDTPFLLKIAQAYQRKMERLTEAMEDQTDSSVDDATVEMSSKPVSRPSSHTSSPIKGFCRSQRLSSELGSQSCNGDANHLVVDENHKTEPTVTRGHQAEEARVDEDVSGCHGNQKDEDTRKVEETATEKGHGSHQGPIDTNKDGDNGHSNQRNHNKKGAKRRLVIISSDGEEANIKVCRGNDKGDIKEISRSGNNNNNHRKEVDKCCNFKMLESSIVRLGLDGAQVEDIVTEPLILPQEMMRRKVQSSKRPGCTSPSTPKTPSTQTTPVRLSSQQQSTTSPKPQTSDGGEKDSVESKASDGNFIRFQKTTPRRGKSIRDQKYQPNRVKQRSSDVPSTSKDDDSVYSFTGSESEDLSTSPPALDTPHLRHSLDPASWQQKEWLRRPPVRKKPWTKEEVNLFKKALQKYGPGKWSEMIAAYNFSGRTNVNLKDKWRTMVKNGEI
ncbi:uncharacterized protein LOC110974451 isoform X2 [Acanthaster planci]|nr:uncharacterized protein LOC110974451 isoform X2 [Acanthaster planci]